MKTLIFTVLVLILSLSVASSQVIQVDDTLATNRTIRAATVDSLLNLSTLYTWTPGIIQRPDSMKIVYNIKGPGTTTSLDSIAAYLTLVQRHGTGTNYFTRTFLDSLKGHGDGSKDIPVLTVDADFYGVIWSGTYVTGKSNNAADLNPPKLTYLAVRKYYHK